MGGVWYPTTQNTQYWLGNHSLRQGGNPQIFEDAFARHLRRWFLLIPAGVGMATARACLRLCVGFSPVKSGIFSAGNGPAMRAALLGVYAGNDEVKLVALVRASSRVTHTDPRAEQAALAVALLARLSEQESLTPDAFCTALSKHKIDSELARLLHHAAQSAERGDDARTFAQSINVHGGVSGFALQTVPVAAYAALSYPQELRKAVLTCVHLGGDTDTTAAIAGGIVGAGVGKRGIPEDWLVGLCEWPQNAAFLERLAQALAQSKATEQPTTPPTVSRLALAARNLFFLFVVLAHGLRRLLPPY